MKFVAIIGSITQGFLGNSFLSNHRIITEPATVLPIAETSIISDSDNVMDKFDAAMRHHHQEYSEPRPFFARIDHVVPEQLQDIGDPLAITHYPSSTFVPTRLRSFALNALTKTTTDQWQLEETRSDLEIARAVDLARRGHFVGDDRVEIDVGGTVFLTSKITLIDYSTYFRQRFLPDGSSTWATFLTPEGEAPQRIFLDQDADAFQVLLSFMRVGYIEATDITSKVLALADILGLERLERAVKCVAFQSMNPKHVNIKDDDACRRFDEAYGGILPALKQGLLPGALRPIPPSTAPTQIAQLLVYDGWVSNLQKTDLSLFVEVKVTANVLAEEGLYHPRAEGSDQVVVPDCHTIHDAINWLYNRGFEFTDSEYHTIPFPNHHRAWENLWFTRPMVSQQLDSATNIIRFDPAIFPQVQRKHRKIASLLISSDRMDAFLYADKGRKTSMEFPAESNTGLPFTLPQTLIHQGFDSRISMESSRNAWAVVSWLSENGYSEMKNVDKLRKLMLEIQYRAYSHQEDKADPERRPVDQDQVDFRLLSTDFPPDTKPLETWPTGPFE